MNVRVDFSKASSKRLVLFVSVIALASVSVAVLIKSSNGNKYCGGATGCVVATKITNDTDSTLIVKQCGDIKGAPCESFADVVTLKPGDGYSTNGSTDGTPQPWVVLDKNGQVVGCLNLASTSYQNPPVTVHLSNMLTCGQVNDAITAFKHHNFTF